MGKPTLVTNWSQYIAKFGGFIEGAYLPDSVYGYFANGGGICYIVSVKTLGISDDPDLATPAKASINSDGDKGTKLLELVAQTARPGGQHHRSRI